MGKDKSIFEESKKNITMEVKHKILLVDDEPDILEILEYNLKKEGYETYTAEDGIKALEIADKVVPDLIILDVMMPRMDGMETCIELKSNKKLKNTYITFLTARSEDYSQIAGFDAGADDYISKPIKPRVLISRIKAMLRRSPSNPIAQEDVQGIFIDRERYIVKVNGEELNLPKKEFELLSLLTSQAGKVFTREIILSSVWGDEVVVGDRTIDVHIRKLREKIGDKYIKTIKGVGYKFGK
ncbi:MAG: two-component system alkaline phosphatase synthesis response regulator PhoP [Salibacteraceae bacterium]|jgi:two-component system alkaline phosphatase synthesis response regulator PhoP|tara:strand:+ start:31 stop:753 length:723 start_codon:yes stop_codon:yes gene_type:complete